MKIVNKAQMYEIDKKAQKEFFLPVIAIVEQVGYQLALEIKQFSLARAGKKICIVAGKGNNAADAFVAARYLASWEFNVKIFLLDAVKDLNEVALGSLEVLKALDLDISYFNTENTWDRFSINLRLCDVIVDAVLGIGFVGRLTDVYERAITIMNEIDIPKIAIDLPSGSYADTGEIPTIAVKASMTLSICLPKMGVFLAPTCQNVGILKIIATNIPNCLLEQYAQQELITRQLVKKYLPERNRHAHKYQVGKASILAGNMHTLGASVLATEACLRTGAGIVDLFTPESVYVPVATKLTEAMVYAIADEPVETALQKFLHSANNSKAVLVGPGLGNNKTTREFIPYILEKLKVPLVLDADALNVVGNHLELLKQYPNEVVITPHTGEFSRMINVSGFEIETNKLEYARQYAQQWKITIVLKGSVTVVATPTGYVYVNNQPVPAMATAGMGDVLAGMIASLLAQGLDAERASVSAVYLHTEAARLIEQEEQLSQGLLASDLIKYIPKTLYQLAID